MIYDTQEQWNMSEQLVKLVSCPAATFLSLVKRKPGNILAKRTNGNNMTFQVFIQYPPTHKHTLTHSQADCILQLTQRILKS